MKRKTFFVESYLVLKAEFEKQVAEEDALNMRVAKNVSKIKIQV